MLIGVTNKPNTVTPVFKLQWHLDNPSKLLIPDVYALVNGMPMTLSMTLQLMLIVTTDGTVISQPVVDVDADRYTCKR